MRAKISTQTATNRTARTGTPVLGSTLPKKPEKGMPSSRAKAKTWREAAQRIPWACWRFERQSVVPMRGSVKRLTANSIEIRGKTWRQIEPAMLPVAW